MSCSATRRSPAATPGCRACAQARQWPRSAAARATARRSTPPRAASASSCGSAATRRPALSIRPSTGRGSEGALAISDPQPGDGRAVSRIGDDSQSRALSTSASLMLSNERSRAPGSVNPEQVANAGEQAGASSRRQPAIRSKVITRRSDAGQEFVESRLRRQAHSAGPEPGRRRSFRLPSRPATMSSSVRPPSSSRSATSDCGQARRCRSHGRSASAIASTAAASNWSLSADAAHAPAATLARRRRRDCMGQSLGLVRRQIVKMQQALAEAVAPPAASEDQRHRSG